MMSFRATRSSGQAMIEYVAGLLVVYAILFDVNAWNGKTAIEVLVDAFQKSHQGYEYSLSQPVVD